MTLYGVGKYATDFSDGTASCDMFGDGRDGDLTVNPGQTVVINLDTARVNASGTNANNHSTGFVIGDLLLFHQTQGTNVGQWELNTIAAVNSPTDWTLTQPLQYIYTNSSGKAQVIKVPQYRNERKQWEYFNSTSMGCLDRWYFGIPGNW
ncbi:MAG: hypothetical protein R3E79_23730 [Caldilineaceae bacterium]